MKRQKMVERNRQKQIAVSEPVVYQRDFVAFEGTDISNIRRGTAWNYLVKRYSIDMVGTHGLRTIRDQFGGKEPLHTPLQFAEHPPVEPHRFIDPAKVDGLSIPSLRLFVDSINEPLLQAESQADSKRILDQRLGSNVGIVILRYFDEAADHFMPQPVLQSEAIAEQS